MVTYDKKSDGDVLGEGIIIPPRSAVKKPPAPKPPAPTVQEAPPPPLKSSDSFILGFASKKETAAPTKAAPKPSAPGKVSLAGPLKGKQGGGKQGGGGGNPSFVL